MIDPLIGLLLYLAGTLTGFFIAQVIGPPMVRLLKVPDDHDDDLSPATEQGIRSETGYFKSVRQRIHKIGPNIIPFFGVVGLVITIIAVSWVGNKIDNTEERANRALDRATAAEERADCLSDLVTSFFNEAAAIRQAGTDGDVALSNLITDLVGYPPAQDPAAQLAQRERTIASLNLLKSELAKAIQLREDNPVPINPCGGATDR